MRPHKLQELFQYLTKNYIFDLTYSGVKVDSRDVQLVFKIDINKFTKEFIMEAYRECKLHVEDLIVKKLEEVKLKIPDNIN